MAALDDRVGQRRQRDDHQGLSDRVEPAWARRSGLGYEDRGQRHRQQPDGHVDEEHPAPAERVDQGTADERPERHAEPDHPAPDSDRLGALAGVIEDVSDDRHRDRVEHRAADRLQHTRRDQQLERGGQRTQQ